eukprot:2024027-Prymnesium_polylepis.1
MYLFFGRTATGIAGDVWSIDLGTPQNHWRRETTATNLAREGHSSCLVNGTQVLVFGGMDDFCRAAAGTPTQAHGHDYERQEYDRTLRTQIECNAPLRNTVFVFGGVSALEDLGDLWMYAHGEGWEEVTATRPSSLLPRWNHAAVAWESANEGQVLAITGGQSGVYINDDLHVFSPVSNSWSKQLAFGERVRHSGHVAVQSERRIFMIKGIVQRLSGSTGSTPVRTSDVYVHNIDASPDPPTLVLATDTTLELAWRTRVGFSQTSGSTLSCSAAILPEFQLQIVSKASHTT